MPRPPPPNTPTPAGASGSPLAHSNRTANAFLGPRRLPRMMLDDSTAKTNTQLPQPPPTKPPAATPATMPPVPLSPGESREAPNSSHPELEIEADQPGLSQASDGSLPSPAPTDGQSPSVLSRRARSPAPLSNNQHARSRTESLGDVPAQHQLPTPVLGLASLESAPGASVTQPSTSSAQTTSREFSVQKEKISGAAQGGGQRGGQRNGPDNQETSDGAQSIANADNNLPSQASQSSDPPPATEAGLSRFEVAMSPNNGPAPSPQLAAPNPSGQAAIPQSFQYTSCIATLQAVADGLSKHPVGEYTTQSARIILLKDACSMQDSFFLALHQLYCLWSLEPTAVHGFLRTPAAARIDAFFEILRFILRDNQLIRQKLLRWFSVFPLPLSRMANIYGECLSHLSVFMVQLAALWPTVTSMVVARGYPLLLDELVGMLHCHSPTMQMVMYTSARRRLEIPGEIWVPKLDKIFREDQAKHRTAEGRFFSDLTQLKDLESKNKEIISKYRQIAAQARSLERQQADARAAGDEQAAPQIQGQTSAQGQTPRSQPSTSASSSLHGPQKNQSHTRNPSASNTIVAGAMVASPRQAYTPIAQAQQQIQPRQVQQTVYPQQIQIRQQAQQATHLQGTQRQQMQQHQMQQQHLQLQQMQQQQMQRQLMQQQQMPQQQMPQQQMPQQQHYHHRLMMQQQQPQLQQRQQQMLRQQMLLQQQLQQQLQHQQHQQQQRIQQLHLQLQQLEQYEQTQLLQSQQSPTLPQVPSTFGAPSSPGSTMPTSPMAPTAVNAAQRMAVHPQQWQQAQLHSPRTQAPNMGNTLTSLGPASPIINRGQVTASCQIRELHAQMEQQAAQLQATRQLIRQAELQQQAALQQQQQGLLAQTAVQPQQRLQTAAQPQLQLQTAVRTQEADFQQEVQWGLHNQQMPHSQARSGLSANASGAPSASVQNLPQAYPQHAASPHGRSHAQQPGVSPLHPSPTFRWVQHSPVQLAQSTASTSAQRMTTAINNSSVSTQGRDVAPMTTVLQRQPTDRPSQPAQLAGQKHARTEGELWPSSSIFPAPGVRVYRHDQPHDPDDRRAHAIALHQTLLRSPQRQIVDVETMEALAPSAALESYYQSVQRMALGPVTIAPRTHIYTYEFVVTQEDHTLRPLNSVAGDTEAPVERQFNGSLRYRLRCCAADEGREVTESDFVVKNTTWPDSIFINLNNEPVPIRSRVHNGRDLPAELTHRVKVGTNTLQVVIPEYNQAKTTQYLLGVEVVETASHSLLLQRIEKNALQPANVTAKKIMDRLSATGSGDEEVVLAEEELSVDLADVFIPKIFIIPVRGVQCKHIECFDLFNWLNSRPRPRPSCRHQAACSCADPEKLKMMPTLPDKWRCPICSEDARPCSLVIDGFLLSVRKKLEQSGLLNRAKSIRVAKDGNWRPVLEEPDADDGADDDDDAEKRTAAAEPRRKIAKPDLDATAATVSRRPSRPVEVIDLDD